MKTNRKIVIYLLIFIYIIPNLVFSEEITTDVIIVIKEDKVVAFSGQNRNWVPHNLRLKEEVLLKMAHGNVGVVITNERLYGFSAITGRWNIIELLPEFCTQLARNGHSDHFYKLLKNLFLLYRISVSFNDRQVENRRFI